MRYQDLYQTALVVFTLLVVFGVGIFLYRELFPQYKIYQYAYKDLEKFRSSYTEEPPAPFATGIQQILIPDPEEGPEIIDRCTSCHVAVKLQHFSPTRLALDVNDNEIYDQFGDPVLEPNPDYVWGRLDQKIAELRNPALIELLRKQGKEREVNERLTEAEKLANLKSTTVEGKKVDLTKVLAMHPLIDGESRPFQFHPMEEYGCTSCHSGNGRALVAKRAHGPVRDGDYEKAFALPKPQFTEVDHENEPKFARMYNDKPGHDLIFQTTPILTGPLIVAKCVQCHQSTESDMEGIVEKLDFFSERKEKELERVHKGVENDREALVALLDLARSLDQRGYEATLGELNEKLGDYRLSSKEIDAYEGQLSYIKEEEGLPERIVSDIGRIVGSEESAHALVKESFQKQSRAEVLNVVELFLDKEAKGDPADTASYFAKKEALQKGNQAVERVKEAEVPLKMTKENKRVMAKMTTSVDRLLHNYGRGKELYISQACYACHRIAGFSRSSVGPELTRIGLSYPWYVKESIVWPQADLPSSTMPNFRLDHEELADLMAFLMAQRGESKAISEVDYQIGIKQWEAGAKMPWELPVAPTEMRDVRKGMTIFVTEGCAACHKLEGYESTVGFAAEKDPDATPLEKIREREWFYRLIPEQILGSKLADVVEKQAQEIDERIVPGVRKEGIIEEIEKEYPDLIEGFYSNFKFAMRARNTTYRDAPKKLAAYQERLHRVLMIYIQEYGMGRDIAPHLNWSGIFRDNAWLMGHFHNPPAYTAKSIMPVMPFDDSKFQTLNYTLHVLGKKNRDKIRDIWKVQGFDPTLAYELLCSACHGVQRQGNGIISEWIYPIPKNLRNPVFLRNLTKERAIESITTGVRGTPMPPWGEVGSPTIVGDNVPVLTRSEITQLVDWLYQGLPETTPKETQEDYLKWNYTPDDVVEEMEKERDLLGPLPPLPREDSVKELVHYYFEARPNPIPSPDKELYYIRRKFYTPENLRTGEEYYQVNCAACHGKEGTGTGLRASSMIEAKPRMFTNLPWVRTRDDMRLMRSIKFGVPGTAMIPWGDQTTATLRMQLTMYIRHFTQNLLLREELEEVLYNVFDRAELKIDEARIHEYTALEEVEKKYHAAFNKRQTVLDDPTEAAAVYGEELKLQKQLEERRAVDEQMQQLINTLKEEREIYDNLGAALIMQNVPEKSVRLYFELIQSYPLLYSVEEGKLMLKHSKEREERMEEYYAALLTFFDREIAVYQEQIDIIAARPFSPERSRDLQETMEEQGSFINLRTRLVTQLADAAVLRQKQLSLMP